MSSFNRKAWTSHFNQKLDNGTKCLQKKKSKFKSETVTIDKIKFDSKKESQRYMELRMLAKANIIKDLKWQVPFELKIRKFEVNGVLIDIGYWFMNRYIADFTYYDQNGNYVVEDVKSEVTRNLRPYKMKKKLLKLIYKIEIKEV